MGFFSHVASVVRNNATSPVARITEKSLKLSVKATTLGNEKPVIRASQKVARNPIVQQIAIAGAVAATGGAAGAALGLTGAVGVSVGGALVGAGLNKAVYDKFNLKNTAFSAIPAGNIKTAVETVDTLNQLRIMRRDTSRSKQHLAELEAQIAQAEAQQRADMSSPYLTSGQKALLQQKAGQDPVDIYSRYPDSGLRRIFLFLKLI